MTLGRIVNLVDRYRGSVTVMGSALGTSILYLDTAVDFNDQGGFLSMGNGAVLGYVSRDVSIGTVTLSAPLLSAVSIGESISIFPAAKEKWAFVSLENPHANDAVWAVVPHSLAGFLAANGYREEAAREYVEFGLSNARQVVVDVKNKQPQLQEGAVAPGAITETEILPGSITTPLIATNAIAAIHIQADSISSLAIQGDAIDGMTITAPLIQSAPSSYTGRRTEMGSFGFRVIGPDPGGGAPRTIEVDLGGDKNLFRGSVEAVDMIVQDKLQLYGTNNYMGIGAKITMQTKVSAPGQPPGMSYDYEERARPGGGAFINGFWFNAAETQSAATEIFLSSAWIQRQGVPWPIPQVTLAPGESWAQYMPISSGRIAESAGNGLMTMTATKRKAGDPTFLKQMVTVWDDSAVSGGGAAVLKGELEVEPFNWFRKLIICNRFNGGSNRNQFSVFMYDLSNQTIQWNDYTYTTGGGLTFGGYSGAGALSVSNWVAGETLLSVETGTTTNMGIPDNGIPRTAIILHTNKGNYVYFWNGSNYVRTLQAEWPITYTDQGIVGLSYDPYTNNLIQFFNCNWAAGADQKFYRYQKNFVWGDETHWINYAWRGNTASPTLITPPSLKASQPFRKGARLNVNVPALPAPQAGVGNPRDPSKDVYGWFYYVGKGSTEPGNSSMFKQTVQPAGDPTTVTALSLAAYPTFSGTVPNVVNGFPAATAASIVSSAIDGFGNPLLSIDGNGLIVGKDLIYSGKIESVASDGNGPIVQLQQAAAAGRVGPYRWLSTLKPPAGEMGVFTTWAPTMVSGGAMGTGATSSGIYSIMGNIVFFEALFTLGTGGTCPSGSVFSLPFAPAGIISSYMDQIDVSVVDSGNNVFRGQTLLFASGVQIYGLSTGGAAGAMPFVLGATDQIMYSGWYRK